MIEKERLQHIRECCNRTSNTRLTIKMPSRDNSSRVKEGIKEGTQSNTDLTFRTRWGRGGRARR